MTNINTSLQIAHLNLENRVIIPPMASQTASSEGFVTQETLNHYSELARSKASMLMVEYTNVSLSGRSEKNQLGIHSDSHVNGLKDLSNLIKAHGMISAIQITHAGGKSERSLTDGSLLSPSGIRVPAKNHELEVPDTADLDQIQKIKQQFIQAAKRAYKAGFQVIELHAAHGYGLNQWLSPLTNKRSDEYGGSQEKRLKILLDIIHSIKKKTPSIILSIRIPGMDHFDEGLKYNDAIFIAQKLEEMGVSILNISSGLGGWRRPRDRSGEGYLVDDAQMIKENVNIPIIGVGGIRTREYINESLALKKFDLAAIGRFILEDPNMAASSLF